MAYAIVGWLLIEVSSVIAPALNLPDWAISLVVFFVILGFPLALILSWAYELTPDGMKKSHEVEAKESISQTTGRKLDFAIIGALVLALGFVVYNYVLEDGEEPAGVLPNSVAVLPFENLSPDPDNAYFAAGMHEEILNQLVTLRNLSVISRTSVVRYADSGLSIPEIANELNVQTIMEGSVRYAGNRVRIAAQLIDAETDEHLWSDVYERDLTDVFGIQSDIAMNVANALAAEFSLEEQERIERIPTDSPEAYDLYVKAGQVGIEVGLAYLDQAIDLDPDFALAYVRRGWYRSFGLVSDLRPGETLADRRAQESSARQDLEKAVELDPDTGLAYAVLANIHVRNWRGAEAQSVYERALRLLPNDVSVLQSYVLFRGRTDHAEEAIGLATRAIELAPNEAEPLRVLAQAHEFAGNLDEASDAYRRVISMVPGDTRTQGNVARMELLLGHSVDAEKEYRLFEPLALNNRNSTQLANLAYGYARLELEDDAARALAEFDERAADRTLASAAWIIASLARGDEQQALSWLNRAVEEREVWLGQGIILRIKANTIQDPVLEKPQFAELREQLGFTDL